MAWRAPRNKRNSLQLTPDACSGKQCLAASAPTFDLPGSYCACAALACASGPTLLKRRVEAFQLDTGVDRREVPVGLGIVGIASCVCQASTSRVGAQASGMRRSRHGEDGQHRLGEVQPATVLGSVMPLEPLDQAARLGRLESLARRGHACSDCPGPARFSRPWGSAHRSGARECGHNRLPCDAR